MDKCTVCGSEMVDSLVEGRHLTDIDPASSMGRRILAGLCWVCNRLRITAEREAAAVMAAE